MFDSKQKSLLTPAQQTKKTSGTSTMVLENPFVQFGMKKEAETRSGNNAVKYSTSGSNFVDQFASASKYKAPRTYAEVSKDMAILWAQNAKLTIIFTFYIRMITRVVQLFTGERTSNPQRGQGLKHEGIFRMMWIALNHPETFWKNITLFIAIGSWKDIITMLSYDLQYNKWSGRVLDWNKFGDLIKAGLENPNTRQLILKYLPQIKAISQCKTIESQADTIIAKWICSLLFGGKPEGNDSGSTYKKYRKLKSSGTAHEWQQLISRKDFLNINFDSIHGRALAQLVSGKFLKNQGLERKYQKWIEARPVAKFVGYAYELVSGKVLHSLAPYQKFTINAQFNQLVEVAKKGLTNQGIRPIGVLDASGSMSSPMYIGSGETGSLKSIEVAMSSLIFFNEMMDKKSPFYNVFLDFGSKTSMNFLQGSNFLEKYQQCPRPFGGTNFQGVFDFLVEFKRKNPTVSEELIPNFIVAFSDVEFNSVGRESSNVEVGREKLRKGGFSKEYCDSFGICFVDLPNTYYGRPSTKFETFANAKNTFYFSGYDLSPLAFLFGVEGKTIDTIPTTADELFQAAMDQEVLRMIEL